MIRKVVNDTKELGNNNSSHMLSIYCVSHNWRGGGRGNCPIFLCNPHNNLNEAGLLAQNPDEETEAQKESAVCVRQSWDLNPGTCAPSHTTCFGYRHSHERPHYVDPGAKVSPSIQPRTPGPLWAPEGWGRAAPREGLQAGPGEQGRPLLYPLSTQRNPQTPLSLGLAPLGTPLNRSQCTANSWGLQKSAPRLAAPPSPRQNQTPGPAPALTSGVGHDLGLLWMDSEREELERDSAFLAVLRGTPARVAGADSEDFGVQCPGEPGGRSKSKEKMTGGLEGCGLRKDQGPRVLLDLEVRPSVAKFPSKKGNTGNLLSGGGGDLHVLSHRILRAAR